MKKGVSFPNYLTVSFILAIVLIFWVALFPLRSYAECEVFEPGHVLEQTDVDGLSDKYFGADKFYLFVGVSGERYLPEALHKENVEKFSLKYLKERMLPCTGQKEVEVIGNYHDERLQKENVLIAYINVSYHRAIRAPANAATVFNQDTVMIRSGYYRTAPYKEMQFLNDKILFRSLERNNEEIEKDIEAFIKIGLKPELKYHRWE